MTQFNLELGFDWNSQSSLRLSGAAQLQACLSEAMQEGGSRVASFYGEVRTGDQMTVSIVDITDNDTLALEVISAVLIFSRADRSTTGANTPFDVRYFAAAGASLESTRELKDNHEYNVEAAPTWALGAGSVLYAGTFSFSAAIIVQDPVTSALRTYIIDPEMEVGPGTDGDIDRPT